MTETGAEQSNHSNARGIPRVDGGGDVVTPLCLLGLPQCSILHSHKKSERKFLLSSPSRVTAVEKETKVLAPVRHLPFAI